MCDLGCNWLVIFPKRLRCSRNGSCPKNLLAWISIFQLQKEVPPLHSLLTPVMVKSGPQQPRTKHRCCCWVWVRRILPRLQQQVAAVFPTGTLTHISWFALDYRRPIAGPSRSARHSPSPSSPEAESPLDRPCHPHAVLAC